MNVLETRLMGMEEVIRENSRLERLLEFRRRLIYSSRAASVVGRDPTLWNSSMVIDKGARDGIEVGMPVVNDIGVVGKIAEVGQHKAKVILVTDPQFSVAALVKRPRESGLVTGSLNGLCRMRYLNQETEVRVTDQVMTSKLSSSFPEGLLIGEVVKVEADPRSPSTICVIKPAVALSQLEEVLVILTGENKRSDTW